MTVLNQPWQIELYRLKVVEKALKLEILGLKRGGGRSMYSLIKEEFQLSGSKKKVLEQLQSIIKEKEIANGIQPKP